MRELVDKRAVLQAISELSYVGYLSEDDIRDAVVWLPVIEERENTETEKEDVIKIRPECHDCGEINRAHYYYEMAINSLTEAERQRDKAIHDRDLWEGFYMRAKLHPFKFLISRIFNRPWLPFEPTMKRRFGGHNATND